MANSSYKRQWRSQRSVGTRPPIRPDRRQPLVPVPKRRLVDEQLDADSDEESR